MIVLITLLKSCKDFRSSFRTRKAICVSIIKLTYYCNTQTIIITFTAFPHWKQVNFSSFLMYVYSCCVSLSLSAENRFPLSLSPPLCIYNQFSVLDWISFQYSAIAFCFMALQRSIYILEKKRLFLVYCTTPFLFKLYALHCLKAFSLSLDATLCNIL